METKTTDPVEEYLKKTGQTRQELFAGATMVGWNHIIEDLVPMALEQNKKLVWKVTDEEIGLGEYSLEDLS